MPGVHQLETLVETTIVEAAVPVEARSCTWPVPVEPVCTTLLSDANQVSRKRSNDGGDSQAKHNFSSNTDSSRTVKRYKSERMTNPCQGNISETAKTGRGETVEVRQRIDGVLDQFLADYKQEEDTNLEEESIENIQKFLDEWNLTPPATAILN